MSERDLTPSEEAGLIDEHSPRDTNLALARAGLSIVPGGGIVAEALNQIPSRRQQRTLAFLVRVAAEVEAIRADLDENVVRTGDFPDLLEDVLEKALERSQAEKVEYYAAALAHSASRQAPPRAERDRMLGILEEVRTPHLDLLALVATTTDGAAPEFYMGGVDSVIERQWPDADLAQVKMDWGDLARLGVLEQYPSGMMTREGATNLSARLTAFGRRFHAFIEPRKHA